MKPTKQNISGTDFFGDEVSCSLETMTKLLGQPPAGPFIDDKAQYEWLMELEDGTVFTVYDYKHRKIEQDTIVYWHIGAFSSSASKRAKNEILKNEN
jgi:hypothetical protein